MEKHDFTVESLQEWWLELPMAMTTMITRLTSLFLSLLSPSIFSFPLFFIWSGLLCLWCPDHAVSVFSLYLECGHHIVSYQT